MNNKQLVFIYNSHITGKMNVQLNSQLIKLSKFEIDIKHFIVNKITHQWDIYYIMLVCDIRNNYIITFSFTKFDVVFIFVNIGDHSYRLTCLLLTWAIFKSIYILLN